jgi:Putative Ig domain
MSVAFVQTVKNSNSGGTSVTSPSITPTTGNCLVASVGWIAGGSFTLLTDSNGSNRWAFIGSKNQNGSSTLIFACKVVSSGAITVTSNFSSSVPCDIIVDEYSGFTFEGGNYGSTNGAQGTNVVTLPTSIIVPAGDLVVFSIYDRSHQSTFTFSPTGPIINNTTANPNLEALASGYFLAPSGNLGGQTATASGGTSNGLSVCLFDISTPVAPNSLQAPEPLQDPQGQICNIIRTTGGAPPVPVAKNLAGCTIGTAYSETITVQSGTGPYVFSVSVGSLPPGLSLGSSTGVISGTPTSTPATYTFTIQVIDSLGNVGSQIFQIISSNPALGGGGASVFLS